jgi:hypothetical protein
MRRIVLSLLAALALLFSSVIWSAAASAYPVSTCSQIAASTTSPYVGETLEVSGAGFHLNEDVKIYIGGSVSHRSGTTCGLILTGGVFVGTGHTDAQGAFDPLVKVPDLVGTQPLTAVGASGAQDDISSVPITIRLGAGVGGVSASASVSAAAVAATPAGVAASGSGLPFTGTPVLVLLIVGVALVAGGGTVVAASRRRGHRSHA